MVPLSVGAEPVGLGPLGIDALMTARSPVPILCVFMSPYALKRNSAAVHSHVLLELQLRPATEAFL